MTKQKLGLIVGGLVWGVRLEGVPHDQPPSLDVDLARMLVGRTLERARDRIVEEALKSR